MGIEISTGMGLGTSMRISLGMGTGTPMGLETYTAIGLGPFMEPGTPMGTSMGLETSGMCLGIPMGTGPGKGDEDKPIPGDRGLCSSSPP